MKNALSAAVLIILFLGLSLANPRNNSLVVAAAKEPTVLGDFWGFIGNNATASEIENYLWAGLEYVDLDGADQPYLATEVPTVANGRVQVVDLGSGKKKIEVHYTLRPDARWSDGAPVTTADVQFFYEVGKYPGAPVQNPNYWKRIGLTVQDERNFTVSFEPAYFYDLAGPAIGLAPAHIMAAEWERTKTALSGLDPKRERDRITELYQNFIAHFSAPGSLAGELVYSGPFVLKNWHAGKSLELVRNPRFFITPPGGNGKYVQQITYRFIPDANALLVALLGGGIDATASTALNFEEARAPQLTRRARGRFDVWMVPGFIWEHAEVNKFASVQRVKDLMLDDPRTRQALLYAMNRQGLVEAFFDDLQPVADTWLPNAADVKKYPYAPEKARQILAALGWRDLDGDGYLERHTKDGRIVRFELEYVTTAGNRLRERIQDFFSNNLKRAGIKVVAKNAPAAEVFAKDFFFHAYDGAWKGLFEFAWFSGPGDDASAYTCKDYLSGKTYLPTPANGYNGVNFGWCNPEFDRLRARALVEFDPEKRRQYLAQMQLIWAEELPALPLYWRANPLVVRKGLVNFVASAYSGGLGYPNTTPWLIGWAENGAQQVYDQSKYGRNALER